MLDARHVTILLASFGVLLASSCELDVLDMHNPAVAAKAKSYGVRTVPAVAVDGRLAACCAGSGPNEALLRAAGVGVPLP